MLQRGLALLQKRVIDAELLANLLRFGRVLAVDGINVEIVDEIKEDSRHFGRRGECILQLRKKCLRVEVENDIEISKKNMTKKIFLKKKIKKKT